MAQNRQAPAKPTMTDAAIKAKTGKGWETWYAALDKAGATKLDHKAIAKLLESKMGLSDWHAQMVSVSYERARGIRAVNQKCDSEFSVNVTRDKYWRGKWNKDGRISFSFYAKGEKAQIVVDSGKLADSVMVEKERTAWKKALTKLEAML